MVHQSRLLAALMAATAMPAALNAQGVGDEQSGSAQPVLQTQGVAPIVVTAERRADTLQDVPLSISAVTGEALEQSNIYDTEALASTIPGLVLQRDVVGKAVIRGVGTENFTVGGDPGVAVYVDGAYMARSSTAIFDFFDVERVEVLRGPQGTLYGRNATGGVINVISRAPTDEFEARGSVSYGNYDALRTEAAISGPITDGIRARVAGVYSRRDGFTENIFPGIGSRGLDELDTKDLWALRGRIDFDISDRLALELIGDIYRDDSNPPAFWYTDDTLPWQSPTSVFPRDLRTVSQGYETATPGFTSLTVGQANRQDQTGITGRLTWEGDDFTITSVSAYRDIEFDWVNDGDGLSDFLVVYFQRDQSEQFSQDIQIASNGDGPFQWIAGAFYLTEDAEGLSAIPLGPTFVPPTGFTVVFDGTNETEAWGVFAEGSYTFGDVTVTAGLRYSDETKDATLATPLFEGDTTFPVQTGSGSFDALTPRFVIQYEPTDDLNFYASVTRGFKSGGFSLLDNPLNAFDAETIWAYEIGMRSQFANNRVRLNLSGFYYDYRDQQLSRVTNLATQTTNAGSSTIWGIEGEFVAIPVEGFRLEGNITILNTEFDEFCTADTRNPALPLDPANCTFDNGMGGTFVTSNLAGNELPRAPDVTAFLAATYETALSNNLDGFIRAEWQYTGDQFFSVFNRASIAQEAYSLFNASAGISAADNSWNARIWVRNLGDEEYFSNLFESGVTNTLVIPQGFVGPPRTYGVTVGFNF
jgi:iron complex outermembrane receptor protein